MKPRVARSRAALAATVTGIDCGQRDAAAIAPLRQALIKDRLLSGLFEGATPPRHRSRHKGQDVAIAISDDRRTMHRAHPDLPPGERRSIHRMVLAPA